MVYSMFSLSGRMKLHEARHAQGHLALAVGGLLVAVTLSLLVCTRSLLGKRNDQVVDTIIADAGWDVL